MVNSFTGIYGPTGEHVMELFEFLIVALLLITGVPSVIYLFQQIARNGK